MGTHEKYMENIANYSVILHVRFVNTGYMINGKVTKLRIFVVHDADVRPCEGCFQLVLRSAIL